MSINSVHPQSTVLEPEKAEEVSKTNTTCSWPISSLTGEAQSGTRTSPCLLRFSSCTWDHRAVKKEFLWFLSPTEAGVATTCHLFGSWHGPHNRAWEQLRKAHAQMPNALVSFGVYCTIHKCHQISRSKKREAPRSSLVFSNKQLRLRSCKVIWGLDSSIWTSTKQQRPSTSANWSPCHLVHWTTMPFQVA